RTQTARVGQFVQLRLVGEPSLHRTESAHRPTGRIVGEHSPTVHTGIRHVVRPHAERGRVTDLRGGGRRVRTTVQVHPCFDITNPAVPVGAVFIVHRPRMTVHMPVERLIT